MNRILVDGETYHLINSAHVEKIIINGKEHSTSGPVLLYSKKTTNAGTMWGTDDVIIVINNTKIKIDNALWVYGTRKTVEGIKTPCKIPTDKIPETLTLIIIHPCNPKPYKHPAPTRHQ